MPMPQWFGHINKHIFNKLELRRGERPVLTHVGRSTGTVFHTPLDAHKVDDGYIFILVYGSRSDWVQNVLAAGSATLSVGGEDVRLVSPTVITKDEAWRQLPPTTKRPPDFFRIDEYLHMATG